MLNVRLPKRSYKNKNVQASNASETITTSARVPRVIPSPASKSSVTMVRTVLTCDHTRFLAGNDTPSFAATDRTMAVSHPAENRRGQSLLASACRRRLRLS